MELFICQYCGKEWKNNNSLHNHENQCKLNPKKKNYNHHAPHKVTKQKCKYCDKLISINNYNKHVYKHETNPEYFINIEKRQYINHEGLNCIYCNKLCKNTNSLAQHECRCPQNPNQIKSGGWNKGLTKETDERIKKYGESLKQTYLNGYTGNKGKKLPNCSHPHSEKTKQRLREVAIERGLGGYTYNKSYEYNGFYFDSNWEVIVAKSLDENNIKWTRPERLFYTDVENKLRYYYPDFYLLDFDIYLDPKNDYLLNSPHSGHNYSDKEKIKWVEEQNNVRIIILDENSLYWEQIKLLI